MNFKKRFNNLISDLQTWLILHLPFTKKAMEADARLPTNVFINAMREKFESFTDEQLSGALRVLESPENWAGKKIVAYYTSLGILNRVKEALEQEIFLRKYRAK